MKTLTFWQYLKLNRQTALSCLKICSFVFAGIATSIALAVKFLKGVEEDPFFVFIACELFGYGFATFIFLLAINEGFTKARRVLKQFGEIPEQIRKDHAIELIQKPLNPKDWFLQFQIVQRQEEGYVELGREIRISKIDL